VSVNTNNAGSPVIVLFGSPGSGKGTQAKLLQNCFHWPHISTGDMLRSHIAAEDEIGIKVKDLMKGGHLVPDDLVNDLVKVRIAQPDCKPGVILDGYPRTVKQAEVLVDSFAHSGMRPAVVHLLVDHGRIVARLSSRRQCPVCGTLYNNKTHPPKVAGICDLDGAELTIREDDKEEVIQARLDEYDMQTHPLLDYFRQAGLPMIETQGASKPPEQIMKSICDSLLQAGMIPAEIVPSVNGAL
jgi:adenylate kinase